MPSNKPQDYAAALLPPGIAGAVQRASINLGLFTVNTTKTTLAHIFERAAVIREIWFAADAIPADADGTLLVHAEVFDASEAALDLIVNGFDTEAQLTVAKVAKKATLVEGTENELTVAAGDTLQFRQVNNSAAVETNANVVATVLYQVLEAVAS